MADVKTLTINDITYNIKDEAARQSLADVVHKTGTETISGAKTFTSILHSVSPDSASNDDSVPTTEWVNNAISGGAVATDSNLSTWSTNFSNCVTKRPNNINCYIERNNNTDTFVLKAGSKIYVPNGVNIFTEITIPNDITTSNGLEYATSYYFVNIAGTEIVTSVAGQIYSGSSYTGGTYGVWYDTVNNVIRKTTDGGTTWSENLSFPIATNISTDGGIETFNGIGRIANVYFVLPGVQVAIPDGRNEDGSCKNILFTTNNVIIKDKETQVESVQNAYYIYLTNNGEIGFVDERRFSYDYYHPHVSATTKSMCYSSKENKIYKNNGDDFYSKFLCAIIGYHNIGNADIHTQNSFRPVAKSLDLMDLRSILLMVYPIGSIYIGTQATCPMAIVLPGTEWTRIADDKVLQTSSTNHSAGSTIDAGLPNITATNGTNISDSGTPTGAFKRGSRVAGNGSGGGTQFTMSFDASRSSPVYRNDVTTVQPPAYVVNVWRRTK